MKSLLFVLDNLWLYNFHQQEFDGTTRSVLETISFFEEKKWEIVRLSEIKEDLETSIQRLSDYHPNSNPTYLKKERKCNLFVASTMDYFVLFVPATLLFVFLCNRCFYLFFNFELSSFLRPYSFWWILFELLIQNNVEVFSFLCFRNTLTPFSLDLATKMLQVLMICMFFLVCMGAFSVYWLYYRHYGKLAKYFLQNMFRFKTSYILMILTFGVRPFLKGAVHALLYGNWELQIYLLIAVELLTQLTVLVFEFRFDSHRSKIIFMLDTLYFWSLIILNMLFLLKYEYYKHDV